MGTERLRASCGAGAGSPGSGWILQRSADRESTRVARTVKALSPAPVPPEGLQCVRVQPTALC